MPSQIDYTGAYIIQAEMVGKTKNILFDDFAPVLQISLFKAVSV